MLEGYQIFDADAHGSLMCKQRFVGPVVVAGMLVNINHRLGRPRQRGDRRCDEDSPGYLHFSKVE